MKRASCQLFLFGFIFYNALGFSQTVPDDFSIIDVNTNLDDGAVGFALLPDERILVVQQFSGEVQLIVNDMLKSEPLLTVPDLQTSAEKGLLGIAVDPDFPDQPYIYLFHSHNSETNRVSRFTVGGDIQNPNSDNLTIDVNSQLTLIDDMPGTRGNHNGGTLRFGNDKTLYVSHGDDTGNNLVQDLTTLNGKILRINRDGTVPQDNPTFPDEPQEKRPEIFAFGLRNPFRFCIDPLTDRLLIGDVGEKSREELDLSVGGENFGWPRYEGSVDFDTNANVLQPDPVFPIWEYDIGSEGRSVVPLIVYRQNDFPNDSSFPNEYEGAYFYADFFGQWIRYVRPDGEGGWTSEDFGSGFLSTVDAALGADGSIYILQYGRRLRKIVYMNPPVPVEMSFFSADIDKDKVILRWITESETINFGFEVQKSYNDKQFQKIGFVKGNGTSTQKRTYTFADFDLQPGKTFYRLKQIDTNGTFEFSQSVSVEIAAPTTFLLKQNYPNPFNSSTKIVFKLPQKNSLFPEKQHTNLTIYNILGREVKTLLNEQMFPGSYTVNWEGKSNSGVSVPSGVYIYTLTYAEVKQSKKIIYVK